MYYNLLLVEDDAVLNNGILLSLRQKEYRIEQCFTLKEARDKLRADKYHLIILDINLPDGSGYDLCREVRQNSDTAILILTANDMELDEVTGLQLGADDYMTKPFRLMVLRARVEALLRRYRSHTMTEKIIIDDFVFDFYHLQFYKNNVEVTLSKTEQKLLRELIHHQGMTRTREKLVDRIWNEGAEFVEENALSVCISRLRNKLEDNPAKPVYIQTVYGIGYVWKKE